MHVAAAWPLPGLGLLLLPEGSTPYLTDQPLHTPLAVEVSLPDGSRYQGFATVEEVHHAAAAGPASGLLLDLGPTREVPVGSIIWLAGSAPTI
jgi:hypothetical protein